MEAPDLFAYDSENHCYVSKQPETANEVSKMLRALIGSELECIRYNGSDREILRRLAESGNAQLSDTKITDCKPISRNHVTFDAIDEDDRTISPRDLATKFQRDVLARNSEYIAYKFSELRSDEISTSLSFSWYQDNFHPVMFSFVGSSPCRWLIVSETSFDVHDWLVADGRFCDIRWYSEEQWNESREWQETPW